MDRIGEAVTKRLPEGEAGKLARRIWDEIRDANATGDIGAVEAALAGMIESAKAGPTGDAQ